MSWIGVDLDGTLALYVEPWVASDVAATIGPPLLPMVDRVKAAIAEGREVRLFTARAGDARFVDDIRAWCIHYLGVELVVTTAFGIGRTCGVCGKVARLEGDEDVRPRRIVEMPDGTRHEA